MQQVQKVVLLADSSKFGQQALSALCRLDEIDTIVTDSALTPEQRQAVTDAGVELIIAKTSEAGDKAVS
jgi:DeoR/GlpR family transcriptional regulator of sugar metabolism